MSPGRLGMRHLISTEAGKLVFPGHYPPSSHLRLEALRGKSMKAVSISGESALGSNEEGGLGLLHHTPAPPSAGAAGMLSVTPRFAVGCGGEWSDVGDRGSVTASQSGEIEQFLRIGRPSRGPTRPRRPADLRGLAFLQRACRLFCSVHRQFACTNVETRTRRVSPVDRETATA